MKRPNVPDFRGFELLVGRIRVSGQREGGYTLVELLIYSSLLVVILTAVGGMLLNTVTAENTVMASGNASRTSQLIFTSVHSGVRNATAINLIEYPGNDQRLVLKTSDSGSEDAGERICQEWYYTESNGGAMYYKSVAAGLTVPTAPTVSTDMDGWMLLGQGLSSRADEPIFSTNPDVDPVNVTLNFAMSKGTTSSPVLISTTVMSRMAATELKCL